MNKMSRRNDMQDVVAPFFNDLRDHYYDTGETIKMSTLLGLIRSYMEDVKAHTKLVEDMNTKVMQLTDTLDRFERRLNEK